jgi:hypothetical protein
MQRTRDKSSLKGVGYSFFDDPTLFWEQNELCAFMLLMNNFRKRRQIV